MRVRRRPLPPDGGADVRALLSLPRLPAADGQRVRAQRARRDGAGRAAGGRAGAVRDADRQRSPALHLSLSDLWRRRLERVRRPGGAALRPRRHAGRSAGAGAERSHLHAVEAAVGRAAAGRARLRSLLRRQDVVAAGEPGAPQGAVRLASASRRAADAQAGSVLGVRCITVYGVDAVFNASWTNVGDWIGRVGLAFDKTKTYDKIGTFSSDFAYTTTGNHDRRLRDARRHVGHRE